MFHNTWIRKGTIDQLSPAQQQGILYMDAPATGGKPIARPVFGGYASGFHTALSPGDGALTLYEVQNFPVATLPRADDPTKLYVLNPGESIILHPDGRKLAYPKNDGSTILYSDTHGAAVTMSAAQVLALVALGGISLTGPVTMSGTLNVAGPTTLTGAVNTSVGLTVGGALSAASLAVSGASTLNGTVGMSGALNAVGPVSLGSVTAVNTLTLSSQSLLANLAITGPVSGGLCTITWPHALAVTLNGALNYIPLFA